MALIDLMMLDGFEGAIIGIDDKTHKLVYSKHKCVDILMERDGMDRMEALEFVDYNTIRALPYMGPSAPLVIENYPNNDGSFSDGLEEGDTCLRDGCLGIIEEYPVESGGCSCHTGNPPCGHCTSQPFRCDECGWEMEDA